MQGNSVDGMLAAINRIRALCDSTAVGLVAGELPEGEEWDEMAQDIVELFRERVDALEGVLKGRG